MHILQVISHYVPAYGYGGPLQVAHNLGRALLARGHQISVCCTNLESASEVLKVPTDRSVLVDGISVHYCPVGWGLAWGRSPALRSRVDSLLGAADYVVAHAHFQYASWIAARLARRAGKPYTIFAHGSLKRDSLRSSNYALKRLYLTCLERQNLKAAHRIAYNAEEEMEDSLSYGNGVVVPNGINPGEFAMLPERGLWRQQHPELDRKTVMTFMGRLDVRQKGIDILLRAFEQLVRTDDTLRLVLAGPAERGDAAEIDTIIERYGLRDVVLRPGMVTGLAKLRLLRDADMFLLPSRYEGLSVALLEAMASEVPCVVSDRCGLHKAIEGHGCGWVVEPTVESVVRGVQAVICDPERKLRGMAARRLVMGGYTWPAIAQAFERVMEEGVTSMSGC